jgi:complement component 1 Q subcomponent-binding protein
LINKRLFKALEKEFEFEESQYKVDESVAPFLQESGFEITDLEGSTQVSLKKIVHGNEVFITFNARSPYEDSEQQEGEQEGEEEQAQDNSTDFQVSIKKVGKKEGLLYECVSNQSEIHVSNIMFSENVESAERISSYNSNGEYRGPDFTTLDEKLQTAFVEYLKTHGVNEDLAVFVETYSVDKEHRLYMEWLGKMKNFISN